MVRFQSLGDGNCLYNTQAVWLVYAHLQGQLKSLLDDKKTLTRLATLLLFAHEEKIPEIATLLEKEVTAHNVSAAFDKFIAHCTGNKNEIDWIKVQKILAKALRALVVDAIEHDVIVQNHVKQELTSYISHMMDFIDKTIQDVTGICAVRVHVNEQLSSYVIPEPAIKEPLNDLKRQDVKTKLCQLIERAIENTPVEDHQAIGLVKEELTRLVTSTVDTSQKEDVQSLQDSVFLALKSYLMDNIERDLSVVTPIAAHFEDMPLITNQIKRISNDPSLTQMQRHQALLQWFFEGPAQGLHEYIQGENGIARAGVNAGELEQKILSVLFSHRIQIKHSSNLNTYCIIDGFNAEVPQVLENALVFDMEKLPAHWNALLPENPFTKNMVEANELQRKLYNDAKLVQENKLQLRRALAKYGTCAKHHVYELKDFSIEEYCNFFMITPKEYVELKNEKPIGNSIDPILGNLPGDDPLDSISDDDATDSLSDEEDIESEEEIAPPKPKPTPPQRDWFNYLTMLGAFIISLAIISFAVIWPIWFPLMTQLFANTPLATLTLSLATSITVLFCFVLACVLTEKIHADWEKEQVDEQLDGEGIKPIFEPGVEQDFLPLYQNEFQPNSIFTEKPVEKPQTRLRNSL